MKENTLKHCLLQRGCDLFSEQCDVLRTGQIGQIPTFHVNVHPIQTIILVEHHIKKCSDISFFSF